MVFSFQTVLIGKKHDVQMMLRKRFRMDGNSNESENKNDQ